MCFVDRVQEVRSAAFRTVRYLIVDQVSARYVWRHAHGLDIFLMRALIRDQRGDVEREQAFKLARVFLELPRCVRFLPPCVVSTILAVTEQADDKFRTVAIETLCELTVRDLSYMSECGGLRNLFQLLTDGPLSMVKVVALTVSQLLDRADTRLFIRTGVDVEVGSMGV